MEYALTTGSWLKTDQVTDGQKVTFVNECMNQPSKFENDDGSPKTENVVKARFEGMDEVVNMRVNWTSIHALIEAFGKDSKNWIGKPLTAKPKDATTGISIYLLPDGFELGRNKDKRWEIRRSENHAGVKGLKYPETEENPFNEIEID